MLLTLALNRDLFRGHMHLSAMLRERAAAGRCASGGGFLVWGKQTPAEVSLAQGYSPSASPMA